jgi:hypothetical protein
MARNPFQPFPKAGKSPVKLFMYGDPGTEKTRRALRMPGPRSMIDMERGAPRYGDLTADGDQYMACTSTTEFREALDWCDSRKPGEVGSVLVDPATVIWASLQAGHAERQSKRKSIRPEEVMFDQGVWSRLNREHTDLMTRLLNAPYHVVAIARGKELRDDNGNPKGYGFEGHKSLPFLFETVIQTRSGGDLVEKDRTGTWAAGVRATRLDITLLLGASGKASVRLPTASEAAERDATDEPKHHPTWERGRAPFCAELGRLGMQYEVVAELSEALGEPRPSAADPTKRAACLTWLRSAAGREAYAAKVPGWVPPEAPKAETGGEA